MATITGTLRKGSGELATGTPIRVTMADAPFDGAGAVRAGIPQIFTTHRSTAVYSFTLAQGGYVVNIPASPAFNIEVPSGSSSYTLEQVSVAPATVFRSDYPSFATIAQAQEATILGTRVDVISNGRGRPATFIKDATYTGPDDGIEGFYDAADTAFRAMIRE